MKYTFSLLLLLVSHIIFAQHGYWQQEVNYKMDIDMNVEDNTYLGTQKLMYTNHSPDTLTRLFYHLYFNAFQPGSDMDIRNQNLIDSDPRVKGRIDKLKKDEIGYQDIKELSVDGTPVTYDVQGTILEVKLDKPILPGSQVQIDMKWNCQVPIQIRRSGRDNKEGIRYSMTQWYPKICEYDEHGWHPNPYIGREFHSPWGDWEVNITIDKDYIIGGTGVLQNGNEVGKGFQAIDMQVAEPASKKLTWKFKADNVIDFMWAADPDYKVLKRKVKSGAMFYYYFQLNDKTGMNWNKLPRIMVEAMKYIENKYGAYPYPQYSIIQGGDGGMEYPMGTLITGERSIGSLVGVSVHELMHSYYQFMLATNEAKYPWMDEGFTTYATNDVMNHLVRKGLLKGEVKKNPYGGVYSSYIALATSGEEEPLTTHADHYSTNSYYGIASYSKGAVFLFQLQQIVGKEAFERGMLRYFETWKFKHPNPSRFIRVMERESGMVLDWYLEYFVESTRTIDYDVVNVAKDGFGTSKVKLERLGLFPMPLDVEIEYADGGKEIVHIPLDLMRGSKDESEAAVYDNVSFTVEKPWHWVAPTYEFTLKSLLRNVVRVNLNPSERMADVNPKNDVWTFTR